jgi:hypothetical protein
VRLLTVRQPWASLIVRGVKDIENRSRFTDYRGPLLIHAAAGAPRVTDVMDSAEIDRLPRGVVVGVVLLADAVSYHKSLWFEGPYGWLLANAHEFAVPVPHRGQLAMVSPPQELIERLKPELMRLEWIWSHNASRIQSRLWT